MTFNRDKYLRDCLATKMKAYPTNRKVRAMASGISYETITPFGWKRKKLEQDMVKTIVKELWDEPA